jgi:hypothetical protein
VDGVIRNSSVSGSLRLVDWPDLAVTQDGVITRRQLLRRGISNAAVGRMHDRDELQVVAAGVYLVRGAPLTYRARLWAAALGTGGLLGFATAVRLWGVTDTDDQPIHVVLPHARRVYPAGLGPTASGSCPRKRDDVSDRTADHGAQLERA